MRMVVLLLTVVAGLAAQARVSGVVKDATGAPVAGVRVSIDHSEIVTKDDGRFAFEAVAPGGHTLLADALGFDRLKLPVSIASDVDLGDVTLKVTPIGDGDHVPLASESDCWEDAGNPELTTARPPAIQRPLPPRQSTKGVVRVKVLVVSSGAVVCTAAVGGDAKLAPAALIAARQWRFRPGDPFVSYLDFHFSKRGNSVK
jgi:hypothetical protein